MAPVGSGTITLDGRTGAATGDCVVSASAVGRGPLAEDATVTLAATATVGPPDETISILATTDDSVRLRVDAGPTPDGVRAWTGTKLVAGLADSGDDGRAVLTLTSPVAPAAPPPTLPVAAATPTPAPSASEAATQASPTPTPTPTPPRRTRPDPVEAAVPTDAPNRLLDIAIECRVTTDAR